MIGTYRFYQNGKLVGESKNLITTEGKRLILRYLAGQSPSLGGAIAFGVGTTAANVADVRLDFEARRIPVALKNVDYVNSKVLFKGTIEQNDIFKIYEAGLWSDVANVLSGDFDSKLITTFDLTEEAWNDAVADTTQERTGEDAIRVDVAASSTVSTAIDVEMDLSGYSVNDEFSLAFYKPDNNISTIELVFTDTATTGTLSLTKTVSSLPVGYNILLFRKGDFVVTGTISWGEITKMGFDITAGGTPSYVILDALRIEDTDTPNQDFVLVSRSVLGSFIDKTDVSPMDVEYTLEFNVT